MAIFSPTTTPDAFVTGTLVEPMGMVIAGPSGTGCHTVVLLLAAVPTLAILRVSTLEPVSMLIASPAAMPVVLLTLMVVSPGCEEPASRELEKQSRKNPPAASFVPAGIFT